MPPHPLAALRGPNPRTNGEVEVAVGVSVWCFVEKSDRSMSRMPTARAERFAEGEIALEPSSISGEVRMVQAIVHVERHVVVAVGPISRPRYRTTANGFVDPDHMRDAMRRAMGMIDISPHQEGVVNLGPRIAKRDYHAEHSWEPTEEKLQHVANAINRTAMSPPVVVVTADGLRPA